MKKLKTWQKVVIGVVAFIVVGGVMAVLLPNSNVGGLMADILVGGLILYSILKKKKI